MKKTTLFIVGGGVILILVLALLQQKKYISPLEHFDTEAQMTLSDSEKEHLNELMNSVEGKELLAREMSTYWNEQGHLTLSALWLNEWLRIRAQEPLDPLLWQQSGNTFVAGFTALGEKDTLSIKRYLVNAAVRCFDTLLVQDPTNAEAKIGLSSCYIDGYGQLMNGVRMLLGVVREDPYNVEANTRLARFSIMSGQLDKAKERIDTLLKINPNNPEALGMLEVVQESIGLDS